MQTISSAKLKVINIVSRWPGATHDQTIFRQSRVRDRFVAGDFGNSILVGDSRYANTHLLATPFTGNSRAIGRDMHMQAYQAAIIRTRNVVERQYGFLKRRFPALAYGIRVHVELAQKLISVAAMLHNICIERNELQPPVEQEVERFIRDEETRENVNENDNREDDNEDPHPLHRARCNARDEILQMFRANDQ